MILNIPKDIRFSNYYKRFNFISLILIILSFFVLLFKGLNLGVDFKGGTLIEIRIENSNINIAEIRQSFLKMNLGDVNVKEFGNENDYLVKIEEKNSTDENFIQSINEKLSSDLGEEINFRRVENVGPKVSNELLRSGLLAISLSLAAMLLYIWIRFEWQFSVGAIAALLHDVIITVGIFSILSYEINLSIVAAVLTIVGYSMNDTVVIFDRIRENMKALKREPVVSIVNKSINESLSRTVVTSLTTLFVVLTLYFFGGEVIHYFSFALIIGVLVGTYSSIFVASLIVVYMQPKA